MGEIKQKERACPGEQTGSEEIADVSQESRTETLLLSILLRIEEWFLNDLRHRNGLDNLDIELCHELRRSISQIYSHMDTES